MKNIFKKNQIIIVALAIMIIIAGYLNYSGKNNDDETNTADFETGEVLDYDTNSDTAKDDLLDGDLLSLLDGDEDVLNEASDENAKEAEKDGEEAVTTTSDGETAEEASAEDADQLTVSDTGEVIVENDDTEAPGEAVLVSTTISKDYFANARLLREQLRAKSEATYNDIINNVNATEENKAMATEALIDLLAMKEKEFKTETLLEAKGFSDAIVTIGEENVEVIINAVSVSEQEIAQVQDIITRNTETDVTKVVIYPVVKED